MNVTWVPRVTMMSFGVATQLAIVIVLVRTALLGVADGVAGAGPIELHAPDELELELGLEPELPQASDESAAAVQAAAIRSRIFILTLDLKTACP